MIIFVKSVETFELILLNNFSIRSNIYFEALVLMLGGSIHTHGLFFFHFSLIHGEDDSLHEASFSIFLYFVFLSLLFCRWIFSFQNN